MKNKNQSNLIKVCFAGGGTGGHIYPGLAVADSLRALCNKNGKEVKIFWIGNSSGMDRNIVSKNVDSEGRRSADVFYGIPSGKLRRYFSIRNFFDIFKIAFGFISSFFILLKIKPALLFSKGGFVSVPPCLAAKLLRIPVFTHECDFTPGLATKLNSRSAEKILVTYEETKNYFPASLQKKCLVCGNPVRPVFYQTKVQNALDFLGIKEKTKPLLFVQGGSLGAHQINSLVQENINWLCQHFMVVHQTGSKEGEVFKNFALDKQEKGDYKPYPFIYSEMCDLMALSDVILSRAGANSIWECAVLLKPMVLIPLCGSGTRGDQEDNAENFQKKNAALVLSRENASSEKLIEALTKLLDEGERKKMSDACLKMCQESCQGKKSDEIISELIYNRAINLL
ncbi:MAG: undecaprenyldiphospho-muramoylpentapeptide beta-N-acetylglucosaminyltransferase [Treponema sp.]|nr:undecaprenyldiphospho-muramoylpentapeptide beta-N-acetylglucosaminyltransferase [Treponema sp.]